MSATVSEAPTQQRTRVLSKLVSMVVVILLTFHLSGCDAPKPVTEGYYFGIKQDIALAWIIRSLQGTSVTFDLTGIPQGQVAKTCANVTLYGLTQHEQADHLRGAGPNDLTPTHGIDCMYELTEYLGLKGLWSASFGYEACTVRNGDFSVVVSRVQMQSEIDVLL
ncbi:hypothetical protein FOL47_007672 [Perkinsus chesapeaki]|uniref:Lipoprotein n=1 Tax=Perkinsus chesapeaki TaxID=330153 RepID=A0A7J6LIZ4_PERCH|nr:hypothetical protein FOL47_007672 [Perkinsus chesapeaki]